MRPPSPIGSHLPLLAWTELPAAPAIRVVIPCSKSKLTADVTASQVELDMHRGEVQGRLSSSSVIARDLYTGRAYLRAVAAIDQFAREQPDLPLAMHIASAGYGVIEATDVVVPYDATMGANRAAWEARGRRLGMPAAARALVESCALTVFALTQPYFHGVDVPGLRPHRGEALIISTQTDFASERVRAVRAGRREARALGTTEREVWAVVLELLLARLQTDGLRLTSALPSDPIEWTTP
jgi:hypothetical protein